MPVISVSNPNFYLHPATATTTMLFIVISAFNETNNIDEVLGRLLAVKERLIDRELVRCRNYRRKRRTTPRERRHPAARRFAPSHTR